MIYFKCPECHSPVRASQAKAGHRANCPGCGSLIAIPTAEAGPTQARLFPQQTARPARPATSAQALLAPTAIAAMPAIAPAPTAMEVFGSPAKSGGRKALFLGLGAGAVAIAATAIVLSWWQWTGNGRRGGGSENESDFAAGPTLLSDPVAVEEQLRLEGIRHAQSKGLHPIILKLSDEGTIVLLPGTQGSIRNGEWALVEDDLVVNVGAAPTDVLGTSLNQGHAGRVTKEGRLERDNSFVAPVLYAPAASGGPDPRHQGKSESPTSGTKDAGTLSLDIAGQPRHDWILRSGLAVESNGYLTIVLRSFHPASGVGSAENLESPPAGGCCLKMMIQGSQSSWKPGTYNLGGWEQRALWPVGTMVLDMKDGRRLVTGTALLHNQKGEAETVLFGFVGQDFGSVKLTRVTDRVEGSFALDSSKCLDIQGKTTASGRFTVPWATAPPTAFPAIRDVPQEAQVGSKGTQSRKAEKPKERRKDN